MFYFIDDFKIQLFDKYEEKYHKDPELYLQNLAGILKGEHLQKHLPLKSHSKQIKDKENSISNKKKMKRLEKKNQISSLQIQTISNSLTEIEKQMDSVYGVFSDFAKDEINLFKTYHSSKNIIMLEDKLEREDSIINLCLKTENHYPNKYNKIKNNHLDVKNTKHKSITKLMKMKAEWNSSKWITLNEIIKTEEQSEDLDINEFNWKKRLIRTKLKSISNRKVIFFITYF